MTTEDGLLRDLALFLAWSGEDLDAFSKKVELESKRLKLFVAYGKQLLAGAVPPGEAPAMQPATRKRLERATAELKGATFGMFELERALVAKLARPAPTTPDAATQRPRDLSPPALRAVLRLPTDVGTFIVIVGAGATDWIGTGPPSWHALGEKVLAQAASTWGVDPAATDENLKGNFYRSLWQTLEMVLGDLGLTPKDEAQARRGILERLATSQLDTEHLCAAVWESELAREGLVQLIRRHLIEERPTDGPSLCNELTAHLVDAGLVDHVISANIDDSLDHSFDNELGRDNYARILPGAPALDSSNRLPCLVKLHGSLGASSTLSFASTAGGRLTREMTSTLDRMVWRDAEPHPDKKLYVLSLGYGWADGALARWLESRIEHVGTIFVVKRSSERPAPLAASKALADKCRILSLQDLQATPGNAGAISIDQFLWALWGRLQGTTSPRDRPDWILKDRVPKITRHLILSCLFAMPATARPDGERPVFRNPHTARNRLTAELMLHLIKCKGMINAQVMASDPRLSSVLTQVDPSKSITIPSFVREHCDDPDERKPILVRSDSPWALDTYFSSAATVDELADGFWRTDLEYRAMDDEQLPLEGTQYLYCPYVDSSRRIAVARQHVQEFVKQQVREMFAGSDIEVRQDPNNRLGWTFTEHAPLVRHSELWDKVRWLVMEQPWTDLLVITEWSDRHARMLSSLPDLGTANGRRVLVIEPSGYTLEQWTLREQLLAKRLKPRDANPEIRIIEIPWWRHHNHFTLAFRDGEPLGATFARRYLKESVISPVFTKGESDCVELLVAFLTRLQYAKPGFQTDASSHEKTMDRFRTIATEVATNVERELTSRGVSDSLRRALRSVLPKGHELHSEEREPARHVQRPSGAFPIHSSATPSSEIPGATRTPGRRR